MSSSQRPPSRLHLRTHFHRKRDVWVRGRSKTILIGLGIFGCGGEKSVHGRPSWELAPYDFSSQNAEDFAAWCKLVSKECRFNDRAGECGVVRLTTQFLFRSEGQSTPSLLEYEVKQHDLHGNGRNTIKGGSRETKGQNSTGGGITGYGKWEIVPPPSPVPPQFLRYSDNSPPRQLAPRQPAPTLWTISPQPYCEIMCQNVRSVGVRGFCESYV